MKDAKPVVTVAVNRNNDQEEGASAEERRLSATQCRQVSSWLLAVQTLLLVLNRLARSRGETWKIGRHCVEASVPISAGTTGTCRTEAAWSKHERVEPWTAFTVSDSAGDRPTRKVRVFVCDHAGWILALSAEFPNTVE